MENNNPTSFVKHIFNFNDDSKSEMLNILQYAFISIIPIVLLNKTISKYLPDVNDSKSSLEISFEIILQITSIFFGLLLIHRFITFFPTFSGVDYPEMNIIYIVLSTLMILLGLQTRLGEKVNILVERISDFWNGTEAKKEKNSTPQNMTGQITGKPMEKNSIGDNDTTAISLLTETQPIATTQQPNFNNMYQNNTTPLVNANSPMNDSYQEPMAANSVLPGNW
jgi:hypothetical protein